MTTLAGAFQQLSSIGSLEALTSLALELSANATAPNAVLYSNDLASGVSTSKIAPTIAHQLGWAVIDDTARAKFIFSDAFKTAAATLIENEVVASLGHADQVEIANRVTAFLYDPATSIAAQTSREFIASVEGKVLALTPNALANRIFAVDELPGALANERITEINGTTRLDLRLSNDPLSQVKLDAARIIGNDGILLENVGTRPVISFTEEGAARLGVSGEFPKYLEAKATGGHGNLQAFDIATSEVEGLSAAGASSETAEALVGSKAIKLGTYAKVRPVAQHALRLI